MSWMGRAKVWGDSGPAGSFSCLVGYYFGGSERAEHERGCTFIDTRGKCVPRLKQ